MEHRAAVGPNTHDLKGVASASDDTVAIATGSGTTTWGKITDANVVDADKPFSTRLLQVRCTANNGSDNPTPTTAGTPIYDTWYFGYTLNTVVTNEISGASLASNVITLPSGGYFIKAYLMNDRGMSTLLKNNGGTYTSFLKGASVYNVSSGFYADLNSIIGQFTIASSTDFRLGAYGTFENPGDEFGDAISSGEQEIYADVCIWKIS